MMIMMSKFREKQKKVCRFYPSKSQCLSTRPRINLDRPSYGKKLYDIGAHLNFLLIKKPEESIWRLQPLILSRQ